MALVEQMHGCQAWMHYADQQERFEQWTTQKISEWDVKYWGLGFCESCPTFPQSRSLTIPVFYKGQLFDIRHRLLDAENGTKYCSHIPGLTPSFFNLDSVAGERQVYVVEGEKKAITVAGTGLGSVVGVPGQTFYKRLAQIFDHILTPNQEITFIPDPGTIDTVVQHARDIANKTFVAELWEKPDDFVRLFGQDRFLMALEFRRPV